MKDYVDRLGMAGIDNPMRDVRLMLAAILGTTHEEILFNPPQTLTPEQHNKFEAWVDRRCRQEPLAKILGKKEFWGRDFKVTKDTLDPRPDSETLIEVVLNLMPLGQSARILDLGTGSGCLILTLLAERPNWTGVAVDFSPPALTIAQENAQSLHVSDRVVFVHSDWFQAVDGIFDLIIANPPYIARDEVLPPETLYDPDSALFADDGGLADYRKILSCAAEFLTFQGLILFEIGCHQAKSVTEIATTLGFNLVSLHKDLAGRDRCLVFMK
ncbi:MAG: peptide chain release factor N(5)-glutamine methyltransferase [Candidatus Paracaedibacteraceae bacterium]|nr:peptide chain release factor N(5)-glutamine methyltransferase [Candidatus Paracaedibacteraceae bacterium]